MALRKFGKDIRAEGKILMLALAPAIVSRTGRWLLTAMLTFLWVGLPATGSLAPARANFLVPNNNLKSERQEDIDEAELLAPVASASRKASRRARSLCSMPSRGSRPDPTGPRQALRFPSNRHLHRDSLNHPIRC